MLRYTAANDPGMKASLNLAHERVNETEPGGRRDGWMEHRPPVKSLMKHETTETDLM